MEVQRPEEVASDSDSDDSTTTSSTENLTGEEKFVLRHMRRQEPQGQERQTSDKTPSAEVSFHHRIHGSHCSRLETASSCRTLIIHGSLSEDSWARIPGTGSIQDLGPLGGSGLYLTSTPNGKCQHQVPVASPSAGGIQRHHLLCSSPSLVQSAKNLTRSLPRSVKDFSALGFYNQQAHNGGSAADLYPADVVDCGRPHDQQLKILERLAREMNLKLPGEQTYHSYPADSCAGMSQSADETTDEWSRLSISDSLLKMDDASAVQKCCKPEESSASYAKDFSYLAKPPPAYPRKSQCSNSPSTVSNASECGSAPSRRSKVRRALSRSHPDLSKLGKELGLSRASDSGGLKGLRQRCESVLRLQVDRTEATTKAADPSAGAEAPPPDDKPRPGDAEAVWSTPELVDAILEENFALRQQVHSHQANIAKLQKFEQELSAVHAAHEALVRSCERKESLERSARLRLESELRRTQELNASLRSQVEALGNQLAMVSGRSSAASSASESQQQANTWHKEVARRDALIAQLISQNKELMSHKERQDIELCAQRATLQQQRSHIEILESALTNAQLHIGNLEDECRRSNKCCDQSAACASPCRSHVKGGDNGRPASQNGPAAGQSDAAATHHREIANMEIRIRDLEGKLNEKETLICLLQRRSMDRELVYGGSGGSGARLPESVSMLNRHPSGHGPPNFFPSHSPCAHTPTADAHPPPPLGYKGMLTRGTGSCSTSGVCSSPSSSLPGSSRGSAASVASSSGGPVRLQVKSGPAANESAGARPLPNNNNNAETAQSLDNQLRALDRFYQNKQSLIQALQSDKERFPNYYWPS